MHRTNPFKHIERYLKNRPIIPFDDSTDEAAKYLAEVKGGELEKLFIGWICERDSFFAYIYKYMKREAKERASTDLAAQVARSGFPILIPQVLAWIQAASSPVVLVPVPSRHGVSERFAVELETLVKEKTETRVYLKSLLVRQDMLVEIKRIKGWDERWKKADGLFQVSNEADLRGRRVLLVDDIVTSGSSLRSAAGLLKQAGASEVVAVSLSTNLFDSYLLN